MHTRKKKLDAAASRQLTTQVENNFPIHRVLIFTLRGSNWPYGGPKAFLAFAPMMSVRRQFTSSRSLSMAMANEASFVFMLSARCQ